MFSSGPWQWAITVGGVLCVIFLLLVGGALAVAGLGWSPVIGGAMLMLAFAVLLGMIPVFLNLSRAYFGLLFGLLLLHIGGTLFSYAIHYSRFGLAAASGTVHTFGDALYFSITTWTTLGFGDFAPIPAARVAASLEALTGIVTIPLTAAMLWLWCSENTLPKELTAFDGKLRREGELTATRMRIRTFTGKKRKLDGWTTPVPPGQGMRFNDLTESWEEIEDGQELEDGTRILEKE